MIHSYILDKIFFFQYIQSIQHHLILESNKIIFYKITKKSELHKAVEYQENYFNWRLVLKQFKDKLLFLIIFNLVNWINNWLIKELKKL